MDATVDIPEEAVSAPPRFLELARRNKVGLRVIVCGGRMFRDWPRMWEWLDNFDRAERIIRVADGAQSKRMPDDSVVGADYWANGWAIARDKETARYPADWKRHRRAAGPIRNQLMFVTEKPDAVIVWPGGDGTADMVRRALAAGYKADAPRGGVTVYRRPA